MSGASIKAQSPAWWSNYLDITAKSPSAAIDAPPDVGTYMDFSPIARQIMPKK